MCNLDNLDPPPPRFAFSPPPPPRRLNFKVVHPNGQVVGNWHSWQMDLAPRALNWINPVILWIETEQTKVFVVPRTVSVWFTPNKIYFHGKCLPTTKISCKKDKFTCFLFVNERFCTIQTVRHVFFACFGLFFLNLYWTYFMNKRSPDRWISFSKTSVLSPFRSPKLLFYLRIVSLLSKYASLPRLLHSSYKITLGPAYNEEKNKTKTKLVVVSAMFVVAEHCCQWFLPTTYVVRGKVMLSQVSVIRFMGEGGRGWGLGYILFRSCLGRSFRGGGRVHPFQILSRQVMSSSCLGEGLEYTN